MTQWTHEQIIAYLDGQLDMQQGQALHRERQLDSELDDYIRSLEIDTNVLALARDEKVSGAPEFSFEKPSTIIDGRKKMMIAAGVLAVFGFGFLTSRILPADNPPPTSWLQAVAEYQMLYTGETLALLEKNGDQQGREVAEIGRKLDIILARSDLNVAGLTYKRGQLLSYDNKPLVQFAYLDANKSPIAFCIIKREKKPDQNFASRKMHAGLNAVTWSKGQFGFVVIGKAQASDLNQYAKRLKTRIASL